uniref:Uncharacterized protein n=1 Tax=Anopheles dirus TaxID=7168 RepID=A0A182MXT8_9DIPT
MASSGSGVRVLTARSQTLSSMDIETPPPYDAESLPSYTIVSGLPSYQDAIEQLKQKQMKYYEPVKVHRPSVIKLFESQDLLGPTTTATTASSCAPATPHPAKLEEIRYNFARPASVLQPQDQTNEPTTSMGAGSSQPTPPPPPPPYKSQISTISATSSVGGVGNSMVVELPAMQHGVPITLIRAAPHKKLDVCHYTIEHERPAAVGGRS